MEYKNFQCWLQSSVCKSKLTRGEIAKRIGMPKTHMNNLWNGETPSRYQVNKLATFFGIEPDTLFDIIRESNRPNNGKIEKGFEPFRPNKPSAPEGTPFKPNCKTPLKPVNGRPCVLTGKPNPERAHYTGMMQHLFGKGKSSKCDNLFVAEINKEKHKEFDQPNEKKDLQASHDFMVAILLTIKRKVELGLIVIKG